MGFQRLQGAMQDIQLEPLNKSRPLSLNPRTRVHRSA